MRSPRINIRVHVALLGAVCAPACGTDRNSLGDASADVASSSQACAPGEVSCAVCGGGSVCAPTCLPLRCSGGDAGASDGAPTGDASGHESGKGGDSAAETGPIPSDSGGDGGLDAAQADTGADSPFGSCLAPDGSFAPQPRNCANGDSDCTYFAHQLDCCGSGRYVGVAKSAAAQAAACESMWEAHFPACGCAAAIPTTDDGNTDVDGAAPQVHCVGSAVTGICRTSLL